MVLPGTLPLVVAVVPVILVVPLEYVVSVIAVVRVELVVGSLVVEVVVCLSGPVAPFAETVRLIDNSVTDDTTQIAITSLFVFIISGFNVLTDPSKTVPARPAFIEAL